MPNQEQIRPASTQDPSSQQNKSALMESINHGSCASVKENKPQSHMATATEEVAAPSQTRFRTREENKQTHEKLF